jgi:hypothetical protein
LRFSGGGKHCLGDLVCDIFGEFVLVLLIDLVCVGLQEADRDRLNERGLLIELVCVGIQAVFVFEKLKCGRVGVLVTKQD